MNVYRIGARRWIKDLSGEGAFLYGGRWNSKGLRMLYTSSTISLAVLEVLVHTEVRFTPSDFALLTISVPDDLPLWRLSEADLPPDWRTIPSGSATQSIGDSFLEGRVQIGMITPSVVVPAEHNLMLNPMHPQYQRVKEVSISDFDFDRRLFDGSREAYI